MNTIRKTRVHPIISALILLCILRSSVLIVMAIVTGDAIFPATLTVLLHLGFTVALGSTLLLLWVLVGFSILRIVMTAFALVILSFSLFLSLSDPILMAIIGERLTPSTLSHFAGPGLFLSDYFWKPVINYWYAVFPAVTLLGIYIIWVLTVFWRVGRKPQLTPVNWLYSLATGLTAASIAFAANLTAPTIVQPVEIDYVKQSLGIDGTTLGVSERDAIDHIRNFVGLPTGAVWADDQYPLVYRWVSSNRAIEEKPDIFIFVIESLRGESLKFVNPNGTNLVSVPAIEELAKDGVVFRNFLSNGFPSGPGFVGLSSGAWMHPIKRLDAAFSSTAFDRLGKRLTSHGYHTSIITYDVRYDDKTNWVYNVFEDVVDTVAMGLSADDEETTNQFINWVNKADVSASPRPLFNIFLTKEPHLPYPWKAADGSWTFGNDLAENYAKSINGVDAELGRAFAYLKSRPRWKDTVIVILGDHANFLNQTASTGLPVDDTVFTGAVISGGSAKIGTPRVDNAPSSQSDIASTVLAIVGDTRPAMSLGRNLLTADPERPPRALSIRNGGSRLDIGNKSMMLPESKASRAEITEKSGAEPQMLGTLPPAEDFEKAVRIWAWLIENNRVWNDAFLVTE